MDGSSLRRTPRTRGATNLEYLVTIVTAVMVVGACAALYGRAFVAAATCAGARIGVLDRAAHASECAGPGAKLAASAGAPVPGKALAEPRGLVCDKMHCYEKEEEGACFVAGTTVATPTGPRAIETLVAGDEVLAADTLADGRPVAPRHVLATTVTEGREVLALTLATGDTIRATPEHPFFELSRPDGPGWSGAGALHVGSVVATATGSAEVVATGVVEGKATVYNLEVETVHTYLVGNAHALVHNDYEPDEQKVRKDLALPAKSGFVPRGAPGQDGKWEQSEERVEQALEALMRGWVAGERPLRLPESYYASSAQKELLAAAKERAASAHAELVRKRGSREAMTAAMEYREAVAAYLATLEVIRDPVAEAKRVLAPRAQDPELAAALETLKEARPGSAEARIAEKKLIAFALKPLGPREPGGFEAALLRVMTAGNAAAKQLVAQAMVDAKYQPRHRIDEKFKQQYPHLFKPDFSVEGQARWRKNAESEDTGMQLRLAYAEHAAEHGTPEIKQKALSLFTIAQSDMSPKKIYEIFGGKVQTELWQARRSEQDTPWKTVAKLLEVKMLAQDPEWREKVDHAELELALTRAWQDPTVAARLTEIHKDAVAEMKLTADYREQLTLLQSDAFLLRLEIEGPEEAKKTIEWEIGKIAAVDPAEASLQLDMLLGRQAMKEFFGLGLDEQTAALAKAIEQQMREAAKGMPDMTADLKNTTKAPADVVKRIASVIKEREKLLMLGRPAAAVEAIDRIVEGAAKAGEITEKQKTLLGKVFGLIEKTDKNGYVSSVAASAGLFALYVDHRQGTLWASDDKLLAAAGTIAKSVGSADSYAKLGFWLRGKELGKTDVWAKATNFGRTLRLLKLAGPIGDGLAAYLDFKSAAKSFKNGYIGEGICDVGAGACTTAVGLATIWTVAAPTGVFAPYVMLVGTLGYFGFKIVKWAISTPDELKLIDEMKVRRSAVTALHEAGVVQEGYLRVLGRHPDRGGNQVHKDFLKQGNTPLAMRQGMAWSPEGQLLIAAVWREKTGKAPTKEENEKLTVILSELGRAGVERAAKGMDAPLTEATRMAYEELRQRK